VVVVVVATEIDKGPNAGVSGADAVWDAVLDGD
jgi:hypothetical protein